MTSATVPTRGGCSPATKSANEPDAAAARNNQAFIAVHCTLSLRMRMASMGLKQIRSRVPVSMPLSIQRNITEVIQ